MSDMIDIIHKSRLVVYETSLTGNASIHELKARVKKAVADHPNLPQIQALAQGILIDGASAAGDQTLLEESVSILDKATDETHDQYQHGVQSELHYFRATALDTIFGLRKETTPDYSLLNEANRSYILAWKTPSFGTPPEIYTRILVNHGNTLAHMGRWHEAIIRYEMALKGQPDHAMAMANMAQELSRYAHRMGVDATSALERASDLMREALRDSSNLDRVGIPSARNTFEIVSKRIDQMLNDLGGLRDVDELQPFEVSSRLRPLYEFIAKHNLFLHYSVPSRSGVGTQSDSLIFSYVTPLDGIDKFDQVIKVFNDLKETYSLSRRNLWEASLIDSYEDEYSSWTGYVDTLEYASNGLKSALTKSAFTLAYGILDKLALLIHRELGIKSKNERSIYFSTIFTTKEVQELLNSDAPLSLRALASMALEIKTEGLTDWSKWRNALTHRYLVTHEMDMVLGPASSEDEHVRITDLHKECVDLLIFTKSAMLYVVDWLNEKYDTRDDAEASGFVAPMYFNYQMGYVNDPLG